jgi:HTH-type transcriptional regulator, sugar sensing transcriptional regulator
MEDKITALMKQLGFTANAARAYLALLKQSPATGYELAATSGVPRSAIYNVLRALETQGLVNAVHGKPARYVPLPPDELIKLLEARHARGLEELKGALDELATPTTVNVTWTIQGYEATLDQARSLIDAATTSVHASIWAREAAHLAEPLRAAVERGVEVVLFSFTELEGVAGTVLSYGIEEQELDQYWSHGVILIADNAHALVGGAEQSAGNRAVATSEDALVGMARSNLVLDITLFGQRTGTSTGEVVSSLTAHLAPVEDLFVRAAARRSQGD